MRMHLEERCALSFLVPTNFKVLASLDRMLGIMFARLALQLQHNLLCCFGLLVKDRLCLTSITRLFPIITSLSLCRKTILSFLVLCYFMHSVLSASFILAESFLCLRYIHHFGFLNWLRLNNPVDSSCCLLLLLLLCFFLFLFTASVPRDLGFERRVYV